MTRNPAISVLIADDHPIVREGLSLIIGRHSDMRVLASVATGEDAVAAYLREPADIVLMDLQMPLMNGVEATRAIRQKHPDAKIIVLTMYSGDEDIRRALEAGATTYLLKDSLSDDLIRVAREVHAGGRPLDPEVQARLDVPSQRLTPREMRVLELVFEGYRNKEIAAALLISEDTVEVHLKNIFAKLMVHYCTAAVRVGLSRGIIHMG
ncbi:MAG: response regulator transcription factor [Acidobacteria bacterium]|nr:response regulator transcription factor [Acidobacteriota bacterium]